MVRAKETSKPRVAELVQFGEAVRQQRKARGYSQEAFGDACGIDRSYMGGIERGEHNLALVNILKIIRALGLQPSEFFKALDMVEERPAASGGAEPPSPGPWWPRISPQATRGAARQGTRRRSRIWPTCWWRRRTSNCWRGARRRSTSSGVDRCAVASAA